MSRLNIKFWKKKKVFITGHTGFKGSWLCLILNYLGAKIYGYALKPEKKSLFNESKIQSFLSSNTFGDIKNMNLLKKRIQYVKPEIVFHLAAQPLVIESYKNPLKTFETNVMGTVNLLECLRNIKSIKSVVIVTTDKVYNINKKSTSFSEISELGGYDPYSCSKVGAEIVVGSYIKSFFQKTKLRNRISTARAGNVIGGGDYSKNRLLPDIIKSINNKTDLLIRDPNSIRPWQHVLEPLVGYLILAEHQFKGKIRDKHNVWNFGPNKNSFKKVIDIVNIMKKLSFFKFKTQNKNKFEETKVLKLNSNKAHKKLKWVSKMNLETSLKQVIEWNRKIKIKIPARKICENQFLKYINEYNKLLNKKSNNS